MAREGMNPNKGYNRLGLGLDIDYVRVRVRVRVRLGSTVLFAEERV